MDHEQDIAKLTVLADVKHVVTDGEKYYIRKLCDRLNERYEPCSCPDYHHDLAMLQIAQFLAALWVNFNNL